MNICDRVMKWFYNLWYKKEPEKCECNNKKKWF